MTKKKKDLVPLQEEDLDSVVAGLKEFIDEDDNLPPLWFLHTGNLALDYIVSGKIDGSGGYPSATIELFGSPSTGKSLLLAKAIAEMQHRGGVAVLADAEGRWDDDFAAVHGVDAAKLLKFYPETVEDFAVKSMLILSRLAEKNKVLLVLDSLAILSTIKEVEDVEEGDIKADQGRKAQKIKAAMRVLRKKLRKTGSMLLIANHTIANPQSYSHKMITPGGGGVPFQASVRVELSEPTVLSLAGKARPIGVEMHAKVAKNSIAPPFGEASMRLYWASGVSKYSGVLEMAVDLGVVERKGAWYYYKEEAFQSSNFDDFVEKHPDFLKNEKWAKPYWMER